MARFKIRRMTYSDSGAGSRTSGIAVLLLDEQDYPIDLLTVRDAGMVLSRHPSVDVGDLSGVLADLESLRGDPDAIREFVKTRLGEASTSLVLEDPVTIEGMDEHVARNLADYLLARRA